MFYRKIMSFVLLCNFFPPALNAAMLLNRETIDHWMENLGADNKFDMNKNIDWGVIPGPFYTPELGMGIGAVAVGMYRLNKADSAVQNSTISLSGYFSSTGAFGLGLNNRSFFDHDQWRIFISGGLDDTPTYYWGKGFTAGDNNGNKQEYTSKSFHLKPDVLYRIAQDVYFGLGVALSAAHASNFDNKQGKSLGNVAYGPSVLNSGISVMLAYDGRDFVPNPRQGQLVQLRLTQYSPDFGGDARFSEIEPRYSSYYALDPKNIVAWELFGDFTQGDTPWNRLPELGDDHRMRGYYQGRYRDNNVVSTQIEFRRRLNWRHGVVGWLGAGIMGDHPRKLASSHLLPSAGIGYRFEFKPRMNVRLDYGIGKGSSGFYFQVGEAF